MHINTHLFIMTSNNPTTKMPKHKEQYTGDNALFLLFITNVQLMSLYYDLNGFA